MKRNRKGDEAQALQFARLRFVEYNDLEGEKVANALEKNRDLWDSFVFGNFGGIGSKHAANGALIELRDLHENILNADTLLILSDMARWEKLKDVFEDESLEVNEIGYTAADNTTFGCAPFRDAEDAAEVLGGMFDVVGGDDYVIKKRRLRNYQAKPEDIPILVRVWWD